MPNYFWFIQVWIEELCKVITIKRVDVELVIDWEIHTKEKSSIRSSLIKDWS